MSINESSTLLPSSSTSSSHATTSPRHSNASRRQTTTRPVHDPALLARKEDESYAAMWTVVYSLTLTHDRKLRWINAGLCLIGMLNVAVVFVLFQGCWNPATLRFSMDTQCSSYQHSQIASFVLFFLFIIVLMYYYFEKAHEKAFLQHFPSRWSAFRNSGLLRGFCLEVVAALIQPFPLLYLMLDLSSSQYLVILTIFARAYLVLRVLRDFSEVYQKRMFIKQNTRFDTSYYAMDYLTIFKTYAYHYTFSVITIGCALNLLLLAYLMHLCEREYWLPTNTHMGFVPLRSKDIANLGLATFEDGMTGFASNGMSDLVMHYQGELYYQSPYISMINAIYFVGIVATTTGLGDVTPVTAQGKMFAVVCAIMGIAWSSFVVAVFTNKLVPSDFQAYVIDYLHRAQIDREKQSVAANLIQKRWRLYKLFSRLESAGHKLTPDAKRARITEVMTPLIRKFQSIQRKEQNQQFMFNESSLTQTDVQQQRVRHESNPSATNELMTRTINSDDKPILITQPANASAALLSTSQTSYGSNGLLSSTATVASSSTAVSVRRPSRSPDPTASIRVDHLISGETRPIPKQTEIAAQHALKALRQLNRQSSHEIGLRTIGGGGLRHTPVNPNGWSIQSTMMQNILTNQLQMQQYIAALDAKLDRVLQQQTSRR